MSDPLVSHSKISTYLQCPLKYRFRYVDKITKPRSIPLLFGSAVHDLLMVHNVHTEDIRYDIIKECSAEIWNKLIDANEIDRAKLFAERDWIRDSADLIYAYLNSSERVIPVDREVYLKKEFDGYTLQGYIDGILEDGSILEYKTSSTEWKEERIKSELQPDIYALLLGRDIVRVNYAILVKTRVPKFQNIVIEKGGIDTERAQVVIEQCLRGMESNIFFPSRSFTCVNMCEYYTECCESRWW